MILLFPQYNNVLTPSSSLLPPCPTIMTGLAQLSLRVTSCPRGIFSNYINPNSNMTKFVPQIKRSQWQIILTWCFLPSKIIILSLLGSLEDLDRSKSRTHPESTRGPRDCFPPNTLLQPKKRRYRFQLGIHILFIISILSWRFRYLYLCTDTV